MNIDFEIKDDEQLKAILKLRDELIYVYDELRFSGCKTSYEAFRNVKNRIKVLEDMIKKYVHNHSNCFDITCLKDIIIEPQEFKEIKTNITGIRFEENEIDVIFDGFIPSVGYLELSSQLEKWGMEINVKNKVPRDILNQGGHFCEPTTTRYFNHGIYLIEEGTTLGIGVKKLVR